VDLSTYPGSATQPNIKIGYTDLDGEVSGMGGLYYAAHAAPQGGLQIIGGYGVYIYKDNSHILFRHFKAKLGISQEQDPNSVPFGTGGAAPITASNIHCNQCSLLWGVDGSHQLWGDSQMNVTRTIVGEPVAAQADASNTDACGSGGVAQSHVGVQVQLWGTPTGAGYMSFMKNLIVHSDTRATKITQGGDTSGYPHEFRNNIYYNTGYRDFAVGGDSVNKIDLKVNYVGNAWIKGPDWTTSDPLKADCEGQTQDVQLHLDDNVTWSCSSNPCSDGEELTAFLSQNVDLPPPACDTANLDVAAHSSPNVVTDDVSLSALYTDLITNQNVGATIPARDYVEARYFVEVATAGSVTGTGTGGRLGAGFDDGNDTEEAQQACYDFPSNPDDDFDANRCCTDAGTADGGNGDCPTNDDCVGVGIAAIGDQNPVAMPCCSGVDTGYCDQQYPGCCGGNGVGYCPWPALDVAWWNTNCSSTWTTVTGMGDCSVTYTDTDNDGIADPWETARVGNTTTIGTTTDINDNGYDDIEDFLNELAGDGVQFPPIPTTSTSNVDMSNVVSE